MPDLESRLRALGERIEYPPTPQIAAEVGRRLEAQPRWSSA